MFIKESIIRKYAKEKGKRVSADFLLFLDALIQQKVDSACKQFNGHCKTLTPECLMGIPAGKRR